MAVSIEFHNIGDQRTGAEVRALVEHAFGDRPGDWQVSIVGSRENDGWEMKILGPNGFERSYTWVRSAGRAPTFGDRQCPSEIAAGEGRAGVKAMGPRHRCVDRSE